MSALHASAPAPSGYREAMHDDVTTGPINTVEGADAPVAAQPADSFNLVACALGAGALTLTLSTIAMYASFALALAVVALVLSVLGIATARRHAWAAWAGTLASGVAALLGVVFLTS